MNDLKYSVGLFKNKKDPTDLVSSEYVEYYDISEQKHIDALTALGKALSVPIRIEILKAVNIQPMTLTGIAKKFNIQVSSAAFHVQTLIDANLVTINDHNKNGRAKYHSYAYSKILLIKIRDFHGSSILEQRNTVKNISIGDFIDYNFYGVAGMANENNLIVDGNNSKFFCKDRHTAQIIWANKGYITYPIENDIFEKKEINSIEISLEICSEARGYNPNYPSDITFILNNIELCTYLCPGDYGDRYGKYTPKWWYPESTKYGLLTTITIREDGIYLNGSIVNKNINLGNFSFTNKNFSTFTILVKDDAIHSGGFNIFGEKFGDYEQGIKIVVYEK